ncbi:MAG: hypothetical protein EA376_02285 [Phycisphaeraceae bacterium]|nr:MAG: hypothetical protein EA376_02285 [Phycisphaeraceae bacterium]
MEVVLGVAPDVLGALVGDDDDRHAVVDEGDGPVRPLLPAPPRVSLSAVKYAIVILEGAADAPIEVLEGRTPLEAAHTPSLDLVATEGRLGRVAATPAGELPTFDLCALSLLGVDSAVVRPGAAALERLALGVDAAPEDWSLLLDFVCVSHEDDRSTSGLMLDHAPEGLSHAESAALLADISRAWRERLPDIARDILVTARPGVGALLTDRSGRTYEAMRTIPPGAIVRRNWRSHAPAGPGADIPNQLADIATDVLLDHEVNTARTEQGLRPANMAWIWGQGRDIMLPNFEEQTGLRGAAVTASDMFAGLARAIGWDRIPVPDVSADFGAMGRYAAGALDRYDVVCVHIGAPAEAAIRGEWKAKLDALERIDADIVGPLLARLRAFGGGEKDPAPTPEKGWRFLAAVDRYALSDERAHAPDPTPFAMAGDWVRSVLELPFHEQAAEESDLLVDPGADLMEYFLFGGLKGARPVRRRAGKDSPDA